MKDQDKTKEQLIHELERLCKQSEIALKESEERFRSVAESVDFAIISADGHGNIFFWNKTAETIFNYPADEVIGLPLTIIMPERFREDYDNGINRAVSKGALNAVGKKHEVRGLRKDGSEVPIEISLATWQMRGEIFFTGIITDITERKQAEEALRDSEERYRQLFEGIPDAVMVLGSQGRFVDYNEVTLNRLGYSREEFLDLSPADVVHPDYYSLMRDNQGEIQAGEPTTVESVHVCRDGRTIPVEVNARSVNYKGQAAILAIVRDITERKREEKALREAELRYRTVADFTHDWEYWENPDGTLRYISPSCERLTGYEVKEFIDDPRFLLEIILPEDRQVWSKHHHRIAKSPEQNGVQFRIRRKDGKIRWFEHVCQSVTDDSGGSLGYRASNRDITKRKQAEESLRKERDFNRSIVDTAQTIIMVLDTSGCITEYNPYMEEISGYRIEEVRGKNWFDTFLPERDQRRIKNLFVQAIDDINTRGNINPIVTKDGREREVEWYDKTLKDASGNTIGILSIGQDITERKKAEEQLKESLREKDILLREVHHRVKNNLQVISSILDLYGMRATDPEVIYLCGNARSKIHSMAIIHSQFYASETFEIIDLGSYIPELVSFLFQLYAEEKPITPVIEVGDIIIEMTHAVPYAIVLNELITNAIIHAFKGREKGIIKISVEGLADGTILTAVKDDGIGISPEFDIARVDTMGLKLVRNLVQQQLKGTIHIKRDKGTEFIIEFKP